MAHQHQNGPPSGWDWRALHAQCLKEARRLTREPADAQDIAQEAALRAWRFADGHRAAGTTTAWLRAITHNEAVRLHERRWEHPTAEVPDQPVPLHEALDAADRLAIARAVRALDPDDRLIVLLRYWSDQTTAAIAETLALPEGTVKVRLHRARARLAAHLSS